MFTGIIEEVGTILATDLASPESGLTVAAQVVLGGTKPGDSMAIDGTCLTVTTLGSDRFTVGLVPETLRRTNLGELRVGDGVNLERPLRPDSRLGGHFVQGHVDGVALVTSIHPEGNALNVRIDTPPHLLRYIVEKGFIAVDGVSLTVTGVDDSGFSLALVPYTLGHVAPHLHQEGHHVNLEVDILAKYVEKLVVH